jgi:hypothetical protein
VTDFPRLLRALVEGEVRFIIVGGLAATIHGSARLTLDIDVVYERGPDNLARLVKALAPLSPYLRGAPAGLPFDWSAATLSRGLNFTLTTTAGAIDLLGEIPGGDFARLSGRTVAVELFGLTCRALDLDALIDTKRAAGRPKDLEVIAELETLRDERP